MSAQAFDLRRLCCDVLSDAWRHRPHSSPGVVVMHHLFFPFWFCYALMSSIFPMRWFYVALQLLIFAELTVQGMCADKNFCSIRLSLFFCPTLIAASVIAALKTECSTFILRSGGFITPNSVPSRIVCGRVLFAVLEDCDGFGFFGSFCPFYATRWVL